MESSQVKLLPVYLCVALLLVISAAPAGADTVFDDFDDGVIDTSLWTVLNPFPFSSATESGGKLNLTRRPYIVSADEWIPSESEALVVEFDWTISSAISHLNFMTRADGTWFGSFSEASNGVAINFSAQEDRVWMVTTIDTVATSVLGAEFPGVSFSIEPGITYRVRVEDDSTGVRLFINDMTTPLLVGAVGDSFPVNRVVFYNRELGGTDTLDNVRIEGIRPIPEPSTLVLLGLAGGVCVRRRRRVSRS